MNESLDGNDCYKKVIRYINTFFFSSSLWHPTGRVESMPVLRYLAVDLVQSLLQHGQQ